MAQRITLGDLFHDCASRYGDRLCVTVAPSGEERSYAALEREINQFAHGLRAQFNLSVPYMAMMLENSIAYLTASYALKKCDIVEVAINRAFRGPSLARMISLTECEWLITSAAHFDALFDIASDFFGAKPHGRIILYISFFFNLIILKGLSAILNKYGVTLFTRSSVH